MIPQHKSKVQTQKQNSKLQTKEWESKIRTKKTETSGNLITLQHNWIAKHTHPLKFSQWIRVNKSEEFYNASYQSNQDLFHQGKKKKPPKILKP